MERFRPVMDLLFGDGEEDEEAGSVGMESVVGGEEVEGAKKTGKGKGKGKKGEGVQGV